MGRSQRHKISIQGYATDDEIQASGLLASTDGARPPPPALVPEDWDGPVSPPPDFGICQVVPVGATDSAGNPIPPSETQAPGQPYLTNLDPHIVPSGATATVRILGANFLATSKVMIGSQEMKMRYVSATEINFDTGSGLPLGDAPVRVVNSGTESNSLVLTVAERVDNFYIEYIDPEFVMVGDPAVDVTVIGVGFGDGSVVYENDLPADGSTFVSETEMLFSSSVHQSGYTSIRVRRGENYTNAINFQYRDPGAPPTP